MRSYFSQFGEVTRLRLSRNKQVRSLALSPFLCLFPLLTLFLSFLHHTTFDSPVPPRLSPPRLPPYPSLLLSLTPPQTGASKHYAFLEFKYESVAQIVQETMDNYLLSGHILVCKVVPNDQVHPKLWVGANRKFRVVPKARKELKRRAAVRFLSPPAYFLSLY
jgi:RNA recognition motif-containing protein